MTHRLLLVDDEPNVLQALRRTLRSEPYELLSSSSPVEALELLAAEPVDAVVSDHDMPGMNGTEFLAKVRERHPATVRFILTGKASLDMAIAAINEGEVHRFFQKPCNPVHLKGALRQALQQKDLFEEARRLLLETKRQRALLDELENQSPGITHVERDDDGAVVLDDLPYEIEDLVREIGKVVEGERGSVAG